MSDPTTISLSVVGGLAIAYLINWYRNRRNDDSDRLEKLEAKLDREILKRRRLYRALHFAAIGLKSAKDRGVNGDVDRALEVIAGIYQAQDGQDNS